MKKNLTILLVLLAGGCASGSDTSYTERPAYDSGLMVKDRETVPPLDPKRKVSEQDCSRPVEIAGGNLMCQGEPSAAQRRAMLEEEERQARARKEAEERAARARLERERAEQAARDEAARKARAAEEERLAAERQRLEAERLAAELKAREAREFQEKQEAEARARQRAEQEAREAAERERQRLEQEWLAGRALLEKFIANYGKVDKFQDVAAPINTFLDKTK